MTTLAAQGTMTAILTSLRPGKALFRNCARANEITTVNTTTTTTHTTVLSRMGAKAGKVKTSTKLSIPAGPRSIPLRLISRVEL